MSDLEHAEFDLSTIVDSLKRGRDDLLARRASIVDRQAWLVSELASIDSDIARINLMLPGCAERASPEPELEPERKQRQTGVQIAVEKLLTENLKADATLDLDSVMSLLRSAGLSPERSSVLSSLSRLVERRLLTRVSAARVRNPSYRLTYVAALGNTTPGTVTTVTTRPDDQAPAESAKSIPPTTDGVREQVVALLKTAGRDGMARADLAWRLNDASLLDDALTDPRIVEITDAPGTFRLLPEQAEMFQ